MKLFRHMRNWFALFFETERAYRERQKSQHVLFFDPPRGPRPVPPPPPLAPPHQIIEVRILPIVWAILMLVLFAAASYGADRPQASSTIRIRQQICRLGRCEGGWWSGTIIGPMADQRRLAVLTCAHQYDTHQPVQVEINGGWYEAEFIRLDQTVDLGLLAVAFSEQVSITRVSDTSAEQGTTVSVRGFARGTQYRQRYTTIKRTAGHLWITESPFELGESGGSVIADTGVVGVIVGTDVPTLIPSDKDGYVVNWPTVRAFLETADKTLVQAPPAPYRRPQVRGNISVEIGAPAGSGVDVALGDPAPSGADSPAAAPTPINPPPVPEAPVADPEPDWSLAKIVVLVPRQPALDKAGSLVAAAEKFSDAGPAKRIRRVIEEQTGGKADAEIVFERLEPNRYAAVVAAAAVTPGRFAGAVVLVRKQDGGLLVGLLKKIGASIAEKAIAAKLGEVPIELILERTSPKDFADVEAALQVQEQASASTGTGSPSGELLPLQTGIGWLDAILGAICSAVWALAGWKPKGSGK